VNGIILYHALISTCSQKVRFVLAHKGIDYESRSIDLAVGEHLTDWYLAINPNGVVPALVHDGQAVLDSSVIAEYLEEQFPHCSLSPQSAIQRAAMRAWMRYFEEVPTTAIRVPSFNRLFARHIAAKGDAANAAQRARMPLRKHFYAKMGPDGFDDAATQESEERLRSCIARVDAALMQKGPFLLGPALTLADVVLLPSIVRMEDLGMNNFWSGHTAFAHWYDAMQTQRGFAGAYQPGARINSLQWI
jgi:glutathione S-transferase